MKTNGTSGEAACAPASRARVLSLIGNTPLIPLRFRPEGVTLLAKCEFLNPSGSIKDRFAECVVRDAEQRGLLRSDSIDPATWRRVTRAISCRGSSRTCSIRRTTSSIRDRRFCDRSRAPSTRLSPATARAVR